MKNAGVVGATMAWVASSGGFDGVDGGYGGLVASIVDGGLGFSTQRVLTWKSHCVPCGEDGMHSSIVFFLSVEFVYCFVTVCSILLDSWPVTCVSFPWSSLSFSS